MFKKQRQSWNLLEPRSFDVHKNTAILMIAMLGCSEVDIEVSDTGVETVGFNNYRELLEDNKDANSILAIMWEGAIFSYKDI